MSGSDQVLDMTGDERLLAELLRGETVAKAAQASGLSEATARRRLRDKTFRDRLEEGRSERTAALAAMLAGGAEIGYRVLREIAEDEDATQAARVKAAEKLIDYAGSVGAIQDHSRAIAELAAQLQELRDTLLGRAAA